MDKFQYVTVDNILAKYHRDFRGLDINESDAIEWIGEALGAMKLASASEEAIAFIEVKNYQAILPNGLHYIIQIAQDTEYVPKTNVLCASEVVEALCTPSTEECGCSNNGSCTLCGSDDCYPDVIPVDCHGQSIFGDEPTYYRPYFDLQGEYYGWRTSQFYQERWQPVRLSNHSFFNTIVCKDPMDTELYSNQDKLHEEYTIVGDQLRFSFKEGFVAVAYLRQRVDDKGYPMIPDDFYARQAITYFLAWMMKQREAYMHREGAAALADKAQIQWERYIKKFRNKAKMPSGLDQYQNLAEQTRYLIPRHNRYYGFFGKLGKMENRPFNHPEGRFNLYIGNSYYGR